jgi:hypothetical protein
MFELAIHFASLNWIMWQDVWEHDGPAFDSPIFDPGIENVDDSRFLEFVSEYSVLRYFTIDERQSIRGFVRSQDRIDVLVGNPDGSGIPALADAIFDEFGPDRQESFASKLAAFLNPEVFVASDRFSRRGVYNYINHYGDGGVTHAALDCYQTYLEYVNHIWAAEWPAIELGLANIQGLAEVDHGNIGFQRRILDVLLMLNGGRWRDAPHLQQQQVFPLFVQH